ncbi:MAG: extracellular solute-binding protein [Paenibacillaceae bacterium]|nr:extracellular solute-binding protein [Paenibacillaceae bacterium]
MNKRKAGSALLAVAMVATGLLAGCSKQEGSASPSPTKAASTAPSASATPSPSAAPKEIVELKAIFPGDAPQGFDTVLAAVNEKLKKDNVGASLKIQFVSWNDYASLTNVKIAAGEDFDMLLDAPWQHMNQLIASNSLMALDDLVAKAPELKASIPQQMWDANKFGGKIMGIPLGTTQGTVMGFTVRKDLRLKYGLPEIKTIADMEKFLYTVKEKDKDITPLLVQGSVAAHNAIKFNSLYYTNKLDGFSITTGFQVWEDKKVHMVWENPQLLEGWKKGEQFFKDGIFAKNVAQEQNAVTLFNQGKGAATSYYADGAEGLKYLDVLKTVPGAQLEVVVPAEAGWKPISDFKQANYLCIPKYSKHADRVIDVMNWLSIKENHDLLEYGIVGKDWNPIGDSSMQTLSKYAFPGYTMSWRPKLERTPDNMLPDDKKWLDFAKDANNFRPTVAAGFSVNLDPVKTEMAKFTPLNVQIVTPLAVGVLEYDKGLAQLKSEAEKAGYDKIKQEFQKQFDDFLATKK